MARAGSIPTPLSTSVVQTEGNPSPGQLTLTFDPTGTLQLTPGVPTQFGTATLGRSAGWNGSTQDYWTTSEADVTVKVTDAASGWFGTLKMAVVAYDEFDYRAWDGQVHELQYLILGDAFGNNAASASVVLKGWQYTLTATPSDDRESAVFTMTASPVHTPEPGTLALGLLGMIPIGMRALRRRA
jgi:hypothetical protein